MVLRYSLEATVQISKNCGLIAISAALVFSQAPSHKEMILVAPDAFSLHNGSFYSNSKPRAIGKHSSRKNW
jgi:hypothetical protein